MSTLGDKIKAYEVQTELRVLPYQGYIVRLDGCGFSRFTKGLTKPYDVSFAESMILTMNSLVKTFKAASGYTFSDEITLIFSPVCTKAEYEAETNTTVHDYNGRTSKLVSVIASECTIEFNTVMVSNLLSYGRDEVATYVKEHKPKFDARVLIFNPKQMDDIVTHQMFRHQDCTRNSISGCARHMLGKAGIKNKHSGDMLKELKDEKGFDWHSIHPHWKHGTYAKRMVVDKPTTNPRTGEDIVVQRTEVQNRWGKASADKVTLDVLLNKYWPTTTQFEEVDITNLYGFESV